MENKFQKWATKQTENLVWLVYYFYGLLRYDLTNLSLESTFRSKSIQRLDALVIHYSFYEYIQTVQIKLDKCKPI